MGRLKYLLILPPLMACVLLFSQETSTPFADTIAAEIRLMKPLNCDVKTALLVQELKTATSASHLRKKYGLQETADALLVPMLVKITEAFSDKTWDHLDIAVNADLGEIYSIRVPLENLEIFTKVEGIEYIEMAKNIYPKLDRALEAAEVDHIHRGDDLSKRYTGKDVIVGIIDFGFDYTHPTFFDPLTGANRIKRVWEQNTLGGIPPTGYSYGQELTSEADLKRERYDLTQSGHGSHVASIAAGSGGTLAQKYRGVAYESDIVLVSLNARNGVAGNTSGLIDGIDYIMKYAESVGKPVVINLSQGHHTGPHDGTSLSDQAIDAMSGPGRIIVGAVGNEGDESGFYLHFDHQFDLEHDILSFLVWPEGISAGETIIDIWGEEGAGFEVSLALFNPSSNILEGDGNKLHSERPVSFMRGHIVDLEGDTLHYEGGIEINPLNNRPHAQFYVNNMAQSTSDDVDFDNLLDNDFVMLRFTAQVGTIHAYAANNLGEAFFTDLSGVGADEFYEGVRIIGGNENSTVGELGGTAHSIISVGGFNSKNAFMSVDGNNYTVAGDLGTNYFRSSRGPTHDGRLKPDIMAPAGLLAAAQNSFFEHIDESLVTDRVDKPDGSQWSYSVRRGTSMAAPMVAGIVALMLEINPNLSPSEARTLLTTHARQDDLTGSTPNNLWGYGKVNALQTIAALELPTSVSSTPDTELITVFPNPSQGIFQVKSKDGQLFHIEMLDQFGRVVYHQTHASGPAQVVLPHLVDGIHLLKCKQGDRTLVKKVVITH